MAEFTDDKTNDPTARRRLQAREQGQVARSQDVGSALLLLGALGGLLLWGQPIVEYFGRLAARQLGGEPWLAADVPFVVYTWNGLLAALAVVVLPILGLVVLSAVAGNVVQSGLLFLPGKALPDLSRIDPLQGMARLFSLRSFSRLGFGIFKIVAIGAVAWFSLAQQRDEILNCGQLPLAELSIFLTQTLLGATLKIALALLAIAALDYGFVRWRHERDLRMTTQEIREELRSLHGDPQVINRRRALERQLGQMRLAAGTVRANVVIVNERDLAVALRYEVDAPTAPVVVAKGSGPVAERIRSLARENNVPSVTDRELAQALDKLVALNRPIPQQLYARVAAVVAQLPLG